MPLDNRLVPLRPPLYARGTLNKTLFVRQEMMNNLLTILGIAVYAIFGLPKYCCASEHSSLEPTVIGQHSSTGAVHRIISRQYTEILGRQPDASGITTYTKALLYEGRDEQWLHEVLSKSPEARNLAESKRQLLERKRQQFVYYVALVLFLVLVIIWLRHLVRRAASLGMRLLDSALDRVHKIIPMSWTSFCWIVALFFFIRGLFFLCLYPPLEGFDEQQHIAYIVYIGQSGDVPKYGESIIPKVLYPDFIRNPHSDRQLYAIGARCYEDFWGGGSQDEPNYSVDVKLGSAFHPPFYYRLMSPIFLPLSDLWGFRGAVYVVRIFSIAFAALSIFFFVFPLKSFFGAQHLSKLGAFSLSLPPMYLVYSARVSPDGLALLITSLVFFLLARLDPHRNRDLFIRALLIGILLGVGTLVRASIIMWLPVSLLFLLFLIIKHNKRWKWLLFTSLIILIVYAAFTGRYFLHNMDVYGQPVPGQEGLKMAALGKGFPDLIRAVAVSDIWNFVFLRMVKDNLWTSGWLFSPPHAAFVCIYWWCVLFCMLGFVPWAVRRAACGACTKLQSPQLVALCVSAYCATLLGAYLHALSSRIAYGDVLTPSYYLMPAFIPFLALVLKLGQQWPGQRTWILCAGLLSAVFIVTEMHSLFFVGATQWAYTLEFGEMMRRLSAIHPFFPSPMWMPDLAVCMGILLFLIIASIRRSLSATKFAESGSKE